MPLLLPLGQKLRVCTNQEIDESPIIVASQAIKNCAHNLSQYFSLCIQEEIELPKNLLRRMEKWLEEAFGISYEKFSQ